jgi:hypothetical protein
MDKPEYIKNLESKDNFFSVMVCHTLKGDFLKYLSEKKLTRVYEKSSMKENGFLTFEEVIFKSQQDFYLSVQIRTIPQSETIFHLTIYYKVACLLLLIRGSLVQVQSEEPHWTSHQK